MNLTLEARLQLAREALQRRTSQSTGSNPQNATVDNWYGEVVGDDVKPQAGAEMWDNGVWFNGVWFNGVWFNGLPWHNG